MLFILLHEKKLMFIVFETNICKKKQDDIKQQKAKYYIGFNTTPQNYNSFRKTDTKYFRYMTDKQYR